MTKNSVLYKLQELCIASAIKEASKDQTTWDSYETLREKIEYILR